MEVGDEIRGDRQEQHVARGPALCEVELVALPPHIPIGGALAQLQHHPIGALPITEACEPFCLHTFSNTSVESGHQPLPPSS